MLRVWSLIWYWVMGLFFFFTSTIHLHQNLFQDSFLLVTAFYSCGSRNLTIEQRGGRYPEIGGFDQTSGVGTFGGKTLRSRPLSLASPTAGSSARTTGQLLELERFDGHSLVTCPPPFAKFSWNLPVIRIQRHFDDDDFSKRPSPVTPSDYPPIRDLWMLPCLSASAPTTPLCLGWKR
ncbi:hypothetical protein M440DRAFT_1224036 [Trichoderma longibrachiatum ATCC 18648]|uniref:Uncharacterized protein n=1 Tax=Trichoderma longibrachiatum ATCC 18648 TaxID=983965 RepID=A0A2T4C8F5_TRILO|nr:hypothetical protein M440DRAFT_1224036 [Trichoderma longibrachiatum ATCC 18648]